MKITQIETRLHLSQPNPNPIRDAIQSLPGSGSVEVLLHTDDGLIGSGSAGFGRIPGAPKALQTLIEEVLAPLVMEQDPFQVRRIHDSLCRETEYHGSFGFAMFGISAIDIALWDLMGKAAGVPVRHLIGAYHEKIPAYAMVGWLNYDEEDIQRICIEAVEQGFRAVKIKVGLPTLDEDAARVVCVRDAVGDEIAIMVDANQSLGVSEAIRRGRVFEELECYWFEEPILADDRDGYAALTASLDIPVATGENLYGTRPFKDFLVEDAVDIVQGDLRRAGGVTQILNIGVLADAFRRPYASHGGGAVNLNLLATMPNAIYLETGLIGKSSRFRLEDGCALLPQGPGFEW